MKQLTKIQPVLIALIALAFNLTIFTGCGSDDASQNAREALTNNAANGATDNTNPSLSAGAVGSDNGAPTGTPTTTQPAAPAGPTTTVSFEETEFDFGIINEGERVTHVYKFTNTGEEDLVITNAKGSCGCTVPQWPKEPIPPGATNEIKVEFNSTKKPGKQQKRVTIDANIPGGKTFLTIKGEVTPAANEEGAVQ